MLTSRGLNKGIRGLSSNLMSSAASLLLCTRVELLHSIVHTRGDARSSRLHCFLGAQRIWDSSWERILLRILLFLSGLLVKVRAHVISRVMKNECAKRERWRSCRCVNAQRVWDRLGNELMMKAHLVCCVTKNECANVKMVLKLVHSPLQISIHMAHFRRLYAN